MLSSELLCFGIGSGVTDMDLATVPPQFKDYEDKWVAISETENRIIASGETIFEVDQEAEQKGYSDVLLFKVPRFDLGFVP